MTSLDDIRQVADRNEIMELRTLVWDLRTALHWTDQRLEQVLARQPVKDIAECRANNARLLGEEAQ